MSFDFKNASQTDRKREYDRIAKEIGDDQFFTKKELNHLPQILADGEQVLAFTSGMMEGNTWLITLTDKRIIFLDKGMIYGLKQVVINLDKIHSVSGNTGIMFGKIGIEDGASQRNIEFVPKGAVVPFTNKVRDAIEYHKKPSANYSVPQQNSGDDIISKLEKLASLQERGVLTQEEFAQQKAKLLSD